MEQPQIGDADTLTGAGMTSADDRIFQFPHISRPLEASHHRFRFGRKTNFSSRSVFLKKMRSQFGDVGPPLAEGGQSYPENGQPVEQIRAKKAAKYLLFQ